MFTTDLIPFQFGIFATLRSKNSLSFFESKDLKTGPLQAASHHSLRLEARGYIYRYWHNTPESQRLQNLQYHYCIDFDPFFLTVCLESNVI